MSKDVQEALESAIAEFEKRQLVAMRSSRMIPAIIACKDDRNANADIQGNAPCAGARELYGRFCRQRLAPTNPAIFSGSFQPRACLRSGSTPNPAAVMRGVGKMCTIQTSRRPPIARQTQISKTAPMNPAIR